MLLPEFSCLNAATGEKMSFFRQEYGDTATLLSSSTRELRQAYELLETLRRHSQNLTAQNNTILAGHTRLPKDLDAIRDQIIKQPLINVLSATPFSDPEKHTADCKTAISALESYTHTIQTTLQTNQAPAQSAPTQAVEAITKMYDIHATTHKQSTSGEPTTLASEPKLPESLPEATLTADATITPAALPTPEPATTIIPAATTPPTTIQEPLPIPAPTPSAESTHNPTPAAITPSITMPEPVVIQSSIPAPTPESQNTTPTPPATEIAPPSAAIPDIFATQAAGN
jgi:hypothetical protein